jgi:hypothetical protein
MATAMGILFLGPLNYGRRRVAMKVIEKTTDIYRIVEWKFALKRQLDGSINIYELYCM